jgi:hypothetical protein
LEDVRPAAPLCAAFAEALARGRATYNARVAAGKRAAPGLDDAALAAALASLDGVVRAAHALDPGAVDGVVGALLDAAVELVGKGVVGPAARRPEVDAAWRALLEASPRPLCTAPRLAVTAAINGLSRLADTPGARLFDWARAMAALAGRARDVRAWLEAGLVASWRAGLAHARASALEACARLPPDLVALALDLDAATDAAAVARVVEALRVDPWAWPRHVVSGEEPPVGVRFVCTTGGFRGFGAGGRFIAPPRVGLVDGVFVLSDGERAFELHVDFFGATLVVLGPAFDPTPARGGLDLLTGGHVVCAEGRRVFPGLASVSSWASTERTLVATSPISHRVTVLARSRYGA